MVRTVIKIDLSKKPEEVEGHLFHNRYHPDIPAVVHVVQDEIFNVECYDWSGGQVKNDDCVDDTFIWDCSVAHILSGPIAVEGAQPGDLLEVEFLDIQPHPEMSWGHTAILPESNGGGGFLADHFKRASKVIWDFEGIYAKSRHIPGVRFVGMIHPGIVGTAPSQELLNKWNRRETELEASGGKAMLPDDKSAILGLLDKNPQEAARVRKEAARTHTLREHGGKHDIKNLHKGSKLYLPVYVPGANLSVGDVHFSIGDGKIALCGGIETCGVLTIKTKVIKNGMTLYNFKRAPFHITGPVEPHYSKYLTFEGLSVDDNGKQHFLNSTLSFRQAVLSAIDYLTKFGYTREQAYMFLASCPINTKIASIVDIPNACCTVGIPTEVFEFDILPKENGPTKKVNGTHPPALN